ncbi:hypothetical protein CGGC5_v016034 [Colletotrichum fructicola Nara gc5]|uniref:Uncharacterized protein n=1 Tax=Colletotrichum fructicola (strain Nara gc5) TaxID=1213859 RepID=A0A7J6II05_COLFN|nr:hypothetical protein CGGC5_v016034 [Colletotrichum fructicola Nara gc5]
MASSSDINVDDWRFKDFSQRMIHIRSLIPPELNSGDSAPDLTRKRPLFQFSAARGDKLIRIWPAFYQAVRTARQWCWERQKDAAQDARPNTDEERTDCVVALIPDNDNEDISFVFRVGYKAGWEIVQYLEFESTNIPS